MTLSLSLVLKDGGSIQKQEADNEFCALPPPSSQPVQIWIERNHELHTRNRVDNPTCQGESKRKKYGRPCNSSDPFFRHFGLSCLCFLFRETIHIHTSSHSRRFPASRKYLPIAEP